MKFSIFIFLICVFGVTSGAKILGVFHFPSKSHQMIGTSLLHGLASKGHDVTILCPLTPKKNIPNVKYIYLDGVTEVYEDYRKYYFESVSFAAVWKVKDFMNDITDAALRSEGMTKLLNSNEKFDVVIMEPSGNDAFFGLAHVFNSHVAILSTAGSMMLNRFAGNVAPFSFVPSVLTPYSDKMTFLQRVLNTFSYIAFDTYNELYNKPVQRALYKELFKDAPNFDDAIHNASLFLMNSNIIFETPRPYLPNMISVGGMHIQEPKKLPQDLQEYLDNSKEGVILFSLGSVLKGTDVPLDKREVIMKVFAKLPQNILWKFEDENLPGKPNNVKINKWLPQSDILAHPNVKLFITHGGLLSSTESVYRGVPILGMPVFGDQHSHIATFVKAGYGESIAFNDLTEETLTNKIKEVLSNPRYQINIKRDSEILKDQPMKPLDRATFWVEHIIRHNGGHHLRCASLDLSLPQYLLLDVVAFVAIVLGAFIAGIYFTIKTVCKCFKSKSKVEETKEKRKNKKPKRE